MNTISFPITELTRLRSQLLQQAPREAAAILMAGRLTTHAHTRLLVREVFVPPPAAYRIQEPARLEISPEFIAPLLKKARADGWSIVIAHTHPADSDVRFSRMDDMGERLLIPSVYARAPERPHASLVLGHTSFDARLWSNQDAFAPIQRLSEIGPTVSSETRGAQLGVVSSEKYDRSVLAFGAEGQRLLSQVTVGVVGLGGLGSLVVQQLAHLGVQRFVFVDPDDVDETNLNRLVGATEASVGAKKVEVARRYVTALHPSAVVDSVPGSVLFAENARPLLTVDAIFCCTDSHGSRAILNQLSYQYYIPTFDLGVRIDAKQGKVDRITGRVQMLAPGLPCLVCQNLLDSKQVRADLLSDVERQQDPYVVGAAVPQPAVISINGVVASAGVTMMLAAFIGLPSSSRNQIYLGERGVIRTIEARQDPVCIACSLRGWLGRGDLSPMSWRRG